MKSLPVLLLAYAVFSYAFPVDIEKKKEEENMKLFKVMTVDTEDQSLSWYKSSKAQEVNGLTLVYNS